MLLPTTLQARRADSTEVIDTALALRAWLGLSDPPWTLIASLAGGRLLPVLRR